MKPPSDPRQSTPRWPGATHSRRRLIGFFGVIAAAILAVAGRLVYVDVIAAHRYQTFANNQDVATVTLPALRGAILSSTGQPLAMSEMRPMVEADPYQISNPGAEASALAPLLHQPASAVKADLSEHTGFVVVAKNLPSATGTAITKLKLAGIIVVQAPERFYPAGQLAAPLIGSINAAGVGSSGLEYDYNGVLQGHPGVLQEVVDPNGQAVPNGVLRDQPPKAGDDVVLSVDEALQYQAEQALAQALVASHAQRATAVVMDAHTGAILAVADLTRPATASSSNPPPAIPVTVGTGGKLLPAGQSTSEIQPVESPKPDAFTQAYEPGSVMKLVTVSAALATGTVTPDQVFTIPGAYPVDGVYIHDAEPHGTELLSVTGIVAQSSNIGATEIVQRLGAPTYYRYLSAYGFGKPTAVHFPGEAAGIVKPEATIKPVDLATESYGEGIAVTTVQLAAAYNTIADRGVYQAPYLVSALIGPHGTTHPVPRPAPRRVVSTTVASEMTSIFEQVVASGTGTNAAVTGYAVAGKTGTAQFLGPNGYIMNRTDATFAGFAPAQNPAVTVVVTSFDTPDYGAQAAAPAFSKIMGDALDDLGVPSAGPQPPASPLASPLS